MEYRLKKDLPFAKAGTPILQVDGYAPLPSTILFYVARDDDEKILVELGVKEDLLSEGWIEEVKPREFWLGITGLNTIGSIRDTEDELLGMGYSNRMKVREVLE